MTTTIQAWHFVGATLRDGQPIPPDGEKLVFERFARGGAAGRRAIRDGLEYRNPLDDRAAHASGGGLDDGGSSSGGTSN